MKLTHYSDTTGPRANSPTVLLTPHNAIPVSGGASKGARDTATAHVTLRMHEATKGERIYTLEFTPDEARTIGEALVRSAISAEQSRLNLELSAFRKE